MNKYAIRYEQFLLPGFQYVKNLTIPSVKSVLLNVLNWSEALPR